MTQFRINNIEHVQLAFDAMHNQYVGFMEHLMGLAGYDAEEEV